LLQKRNNSVILFLGSVLLCNKPSALFASNFPALGEIQGHYFFAPCPSV
jgi:hypothetical protein